MAAQKIFLLLNKYKWSINLYYYLLYSKLIVNFNSYLVNLKFNNWKENIENNKLLKIVESTINNKIKETTENLQNKHKSVCGNNIYICF